MKRYRFSLAAVLRVRKIEEDQAVTALAEAERRRVAAEELAERREAAHRGAAGTGQATAHEFLAARERHERSAAAVVAAQEEVAQARMATTARRAALAAAAAAVGALEHLDEQHRAAHALELQREEELEVDDLVTGRHARKARR